MLLEVNFSDWKVILIDIIIILIVALETYSGYKKGFLESSIKLLGFIGAFVGAYILKSPLSILMYTHLPFFKFEGLFRGMSSLNIVIYEIIAFIVTFILLRIIIKLVAKVLGLVSTSMPIVNGVPNSGTPSVPVSFIICSFRCICWFCEINNNFVFCYFCI